MKFPEIDEDILSKLPEWHKVLREIYVGVESDQNKSRPSHPNGDQGK
jgi:hypothetical protein